jgi:hypothetical protein
VEVRGEGGMLRVGLVLLLLLLLLLRQLSLL